MSPRPQPPGSQPARRILGRVKRAEFVGRSAELDRLIAHAGSARDAGGLLILLAPLAGVSELMRQAYDQLFNAQGDAVPIYFSLPASDTTAVSAAIEFLNAFLAQYIAFRRNEASLAQASLTMNDLVQLAPAADLHWIEELVSAYNKQRFSSDERELVRFCFNAPRRVPSGNPKPYILFDAVKLANYDNEQVPVAGEIIKALAGSRPFVLAGLRREIIREVERAGVDYGALEKVRLEPLAEADACKLVASIARREGVSLSDECRDLLAQQFEGSPFLINAMLLSAREKHLALNSYFDCERLYVDELLGGRLNHYFTSVLEKVAPDPIDRSALIRLLSESLGAGQRTASFAAWAGRLNLEAADVENILRSLHVQEIINWDGETVDTQRGSRAWRDFVRSRFRLDALREPRALVVADLMSAALQRAPQTVARHYRRLASLPLRDVLQAFNYQRVPKVLFDYAAFAADYKGAPAEEIAARLEIDPQVMKLPQVFHTAHGVAFSGELKEFDEESCVVAHAFAGPGYTTENEIVWLAAKIDSKLEADADAVEEWCNRLDKLAQRSGFAHVQLWLIANEGFSVEASEKLRQRGAYASSRTQFELLSAQLSEGLNKSPAAANNEYVFILPMGADNELLAAATAEQIARRLNFRPEAINQIKTAIVEACINASEHSLSPEQKIYQRFQVEDDKLVITISSRGVLPAKVVAKDSAANDTAGVLEQRRGWGLKLIETLMDEVEFERVDEGTSLRMVKYLRS
ncbi:MAG: serine/threonine-protein kinase RsbW [Pyrinomonadaceae bacterium]|jgi:serine/threonine-protein kinase RsbW|nr:serine/threonine-protein kinase RsbW [Pyrinomonadaceae bacterium]